MHAHSVLQVNMVLFMAVGRKHCSRIFPYLLNFFFVKNKVVSAVLVDVSKAFYRVCHPLLLNKLSRLELRGIVLSFFKNYFTERRQPVSV